MNKSSCDDKDLVLESEEAKTAEDSEQQLSVEEANIATGPVEPQLVDESGQNDLPLQSPISRDAITQSASELIDSLNAKRKRDTELISDFKKVIELQGQKTCSLIEQHMFQVYEKQGKVIQEKIQELFACLDRIAKVESELFEFRQALQVLYQDVHS